MNKKILTNIFWLITLMVLFFVIKPYAEAYWVSFRNFTNPKYYDVKLKEWTNKSTDFLIDKLGHPAPSWDGVASNILATRKDLPKGKKLIRIITSDWNIERRRSSLGILFAWNDPKAIDLSIKILESGRKNPLYSDALLHLSKIKYQPAFPYVIELAMAQDRYNNGSAAYLRDFGKLEALPILENMLKHAEHRDPVVARLYRGTIEDAIHSIKQQNKISE